MYPLSPGSPTPEFKPFSTLLWVFLTQQGMTDVPPETILLRKDSIIVSENSSKIDSIHTVRFSTFESDVYFSNWDKLGEND